MSFQDVEWRISSTPVPYPDALREMEQRVEAIEKGQATELIWLLQHPPLYTAGTSADPSELVKAGNFPVFSAGRGGRYTYHGPGQRVVYALSDLRQRQRDIHAHVDRLEEWVIQVLQDFNIKGERRKGRVGIWVEAAGTEEKIAAIGVRVRRWITYHGLALNVAPDLSHFSGIIPCGLAQYGVTSLEKLGLKTSLEEVDLSFKKHAPSIFS